MGKKKGKKAPKKVKKGGIDAKSKEIRRPEVGGANSDVCTTRLSDAAKKINRQLRTAYRNDDLLSLLRFVTYRNNSDAIHYESLLNYQKKPDFLTWPMRICRHYLNNLSSFIDMFIDLSSPPDDERLYSSSLYFSIFEAMVFLNANLFLVDSDGNNLLELWSIGRAALVDRIIKSPQLAPYFLKFSQLLNGFTDLLSELLTRCVSTHFKREIAMTATGMVSVKHDVENQCGGGIFVRWIDATSSDHHIGKINADPRIDCQWDTDGQFSETSTLLFSTVHPFEQFDCKKSFLEMTDMMPRIFKSYAARYLFDASAFYQHLIRISLTPVQMTIFSDEACKYSKEFSSFATFVKIDIHPSRTICSLKFIDSKETAKKIELIAELMNDFKEALSSMPALSL